MNQTSPDDGADGIGAGMKYKVLIQRYLEETAEVEIEANSPDKAAALVKDEGYKLPE